MTKEQLIKEFREKFFTVHEGCEDGWYACPKSEDYSGTYEGTPIEERPCQCHVENTKPNIEAFLLSTFDEGEKNGIVIGRASGIEEVKDIKKLLEVAKCPDVDCDNKGSITCRISDDEWEQQQCQWCDEKRIALTPSSSKDN